MSEGKVCDTLLTGELGTYRIVFFLGCGSHSRVYACEKLRDVDPRGDDDGSGPLEEEDRKLFAAKRINNTRFEERRLKKEVAIMEHLSHPNIVRLEETIRTEKYTYIVMELIPDGDLFELVIDEGRLDETLACKILKQLVEAVEYMHGKNVVHRDLKPENVLIERTLDDPGSIHVKVSDFGLSKLYKNGSSGMSTQCGSPEYIAPEIFSITKKNSLDASMTEGAMDAKRYGPEVDMWSLGVIAYVLFTGCLPFGHMSKAKLIDAIIKGVYTWESSFFGGGEISKEAKDFVAMCLQTDPKLRITPTAALTHVFFAVENERDNGMKKEEEEEE